MMASTDDFSVLLNAFAAGDEHIPGRKPPSFAPLLLLLRRVAAQPQACDAQEAHMSRVMDALMQGPLSGAKAGDDQPDDARDECVRLLLDFGASGFSVTYTCEKRIVRELAALARVPRIINDALVGLAVALQPPLKRRRR
ncbi:hypothetical protein FOA52_014047 [Chlamydomonas sp. UWO 241]|nr:hypothetical protein FOA52_014047 [Chlamydomonas sp. UWO 241]